MKKSVKFYLSIALMAVLTFAISVPSFATTNFSPNAIKPGSSNVTTEGITGLGSDIAKILMTVGSAASVIVLIILGIKYMVGSPEDKSEYKKSMMPYVIGAVLVFSATTIATLFFNFASSIKA